MNTRNGMVEYANGDKVWYRDGKRHRDDGPAVEYANGGKVWYRDGRRHRDDGPAVEYANGGKEWWRDGKQVARPALDNDWRNANHSEARILLDALVAERDRYRSALERIASDDLAKTESEDAFRAVQYRLLARDALAIWEDVDKAFKRAIRALR